MLHYQSHRLRHNLPIMGTIDLLHRLYTTKWLPAVAARSVGLQLVEAVKPLKVWWLAMFVQACTGLSAFLPLDPTGPAHVQHREAELTASPMA